MASSMLPTNCHGLPQNVIGKGIELNEAGGDCELMMETRWAPLP